MRSLELILELGQITLFGPMKHSDEQKWVCLLIAPYLGGAHIL